MTPAAALGEINAILSRAGVTEAGVEPEDVVERVRWLAMLWKEAHPMAPRPPGWSRRPGSEDPPKPHTTIIGDASWKT